MVDVWIEHAGKTLYDNSYRRRETRMPRIELKLLATLVAALAITYSSLAQQRIAGIGLVLGVKDHAIVIMKVLPDTPASKAGLAAGFMVRSVDGVPVVARDLKGCVDRLRGEAGTKVKLELVNAAQNKTNIVELTREELKL